jgi:hypothetical protein
MNERSVIYSRRQAEMEHKQARQGCPLLFWAQQALDVNPLLCSLHQHTYIHILCFERKEIVTEHNRNNISKESNALACAVRLTMCFDVTNFIYAGILFLSAVRAGDHPSSLAGRFQFSTQSTHAKTRSTTYCQIMTVRSRCVVEVLERK